MYTGIERRLFDRFKTEVAVRYTSAPEDRIHYAVTEDISGNGMKISLLEKLMPGTTLNLEIFKNSSKVSARCKGEIMWITQRPLATRKVKSFEAGVRLVGLSLIYIGTLIDDLKIQDKAASLAGTVAY
ncbi:PilZ domain-containing protein [Candidatus Omnitrophota bacterium]